MPHTTSLPSLALKILFLMDISLRLHESIYARGPPACDRGAEYGVDRGRVDAFKNYYLHKM